MWWDCAFMLYLFPIDIISDFVIYQSEHVSKLILSFITTKGNDKIVDCFEHLA